MGLALHTGNKHQDLNWDSELRTTLGCQDRQFSHPCTSFKVFCVVDFSFMSMAAAQDVGVPILDVDEGENFFQPL